MSDDNGKGGFVAGFRDLVAWQCAVGLADRLYDLTEQWPKSELYGMTSQARRAAVSVPANIAEGQGRSSRRAFHNHVSIAYGSLCELETIVHLARRRSYCDDSEEQSFQIAAGEVARLLKGLLRSLEAD